MAEDADMRNELEEMQQRADQMTDEVRPLGTEMGTREPHGGQEPPNR